MSAKRVLLAVIFLGVLATSTCLLRAQSPELPAAPIREKVIDACTECHDSSLIVQQRLSAAAWTKEVDKMVKWGAVVDAADKPEFLDYLSTNFPPDKASEAMPMAVPPAH